MYLIGKIFSIGVVTIIADKILAEGGRKDIAFGVTLIATILVLSMVAKEIYKVFNEVTSTFGFFN